MLRALERMITRSLIFTPIFLLFVALANAAPVTPAVRTEIDALLSSLQTSGCEFNRNGSWYSAAEAKTHLLRKLEHLEGKDAVQSTEQFIDLAASTSSASGKPYLVRCGNTPPVESKKWLSSQLTTIRSSGRTEKSSEK
ncbi:MAG: DUF5329 domain-containing protein [Pseudomonadota bacterium]